MIDMNLRDMNTRNLGLQPLDDLINVVRHA
jgi:hypothetical protein